mgnify:CR=1 FL=1
MASFPAGIRKSDPYDNETWLYEGSPTNLVFQNGILTLQHPRCVLQTLRQTLSRVTHPKWWKRFAAFHPLSSRKWRTHLLGHLVHDKSRGDLLCAWLDPTLQRRPDYSHGRHPPTLVRQHQAGPAAEFSRYAAMPRSRARLISQRYTTSCRVISRCHAAMVAEETLRDYLRHQTKPTGLWHNHASLFHQSL